MSTPSQILKDRWLKALLPRVESSGWTDELAAQAAQEAGLSAGEQALAAPHGITDLIDHFMQRSIEDMRQIVAEQDMTDLRTHERVAVGLSTWLGILKPNQEAVRKAAGLGLLPWGAGAALKRVWAIADAIWDVAGDTATDYNRQTKRVLLSMVIPSVVLYWLDHDDPADVDAFINRRLKQAMRIGQAGGKVIGPALDFVESLKGRKPTPGL